MNPHLTPGAAVDPGPPGGVRMKEVFAALRSEGKPMRREGMFDHAKMTTPLDKTTGFLERLDR